MSISSTIIGWMMQQMYVLIHTHTHTHTHHIDGTFNQLKLNETVVSN